MLPLYNILNSVVTGVYITDLSQIFFLFLCRSVQWFKSFILHSEFSEYCLTAVDVSGTLSRYI